MKYYTKKRDIPIMHKSVFNGHVHPLRKAFFYGFDYIIVIFILTTTILSLRIGK